MIAGNPPQSRITRTQKRKFNSCGIEGYKADNEQFHLNCDQNAKIDLARSNKKSAVIPPKCDLDEIEDDNDDQNEIPVLLSLYEVGNGSDDEKNEVWSTVMSSVLPCMRFENKLKTVIYIDNYYFSMNEMKLYTDSDPFWPVVESTNDSNESSAHIQKPGEFIDIDEQCIPWKGRHK